MELNGVSAPISPIQSGPILQPQAAPEPPESEPEVTSGEKGGGKANGAVSKLNEGGHFKGVADVRLRISHFDNADLEKIDPELLPDPEDVPGKAYEKFLAQYQDLYNASLLLTEPEEPVVEMPPEPVVETPLEPVVETPLVPEEPVIEIPAPYPVPVIIEEPVVVTPLEIEPVAVPVPEQTEPEAPVDEDEGILAAFEELWEAPPAEEDAGIVDIVM